MNKKMLCGLITGIFVIVITGCGGENKDVGSAPAAQAPVQQKQVAAPSASPAPQAGKMDYSRLLSVQEVQGITGFPNLSLKSIDAKKSGEAVDLTYSTAEGKIILTVQVLRGSDYEEHYRNLRSQDFSKYFKGSFEASNAFYGPKQANPPTLIAFRKGDTLILIATTLNGKIPYLDTDMMTKAANLIGSRL